jgi:hypothetical protein
MVSAGCDGLEPFSVALRSETTAAPYDGAMVTSWWERRGSTAVLAVAMVVLLSTHDAWAQCEVLAKVGVRDFGHDVATSGEWALVGAPAQWGVLGMAGSAHLFKVGPFGWTADADLTASDPHQGDEFGYAVALHGTFAAVGAPEADGPMLDTGAAYLFEDQGGAWVQLDRFAPAELDTHDRFGTSIALGWNTVLVGAPYQGVDAGQPSAVYVFTRSGLSWSQTDRWTGSSSVSGDIFGGSLSLDGNWAAVGAYKDDDGGTDAGAVYLFNFSGGTWNEYTKLVASDAMALGRFGWDLDLSGTTLLVGASTSDIGGTASGEVYFFELSGGVWSETARFQGVNILPFDNLGTSVALDGDRGVAGAPWGDGTTPGTGTLVMFDRGPGGWVETGWCMDPEGEVGNRFGHSLDLGSEGLLVGAVGEVEVSPGTGAVHVLAPDYSDGDGDGVQDSCQCVAVPYCPASPNSTGPGATMGTLGSLSVDDNIFYIRCDGASAGSFGLFLYGANAIAAPLGDGTLCVGAPQYRIGVAPTDANGDAILSVDLTSPPSASGLIQAYSIWHFQFWFRDVPAGGAGHNLSDGLTITFCP